MIKLQNLSVEVGQKIFKPDHQKLLRISISNVLKSTAKPAKVIDESSIQWQESIILPPFYKKEFTFEIYNKHDFGYNPEELAVLQGTFTINSPQQKYNMWQVFTSKSKKLGFLSGNIVHEQTSSLVQKKEPADSGQTKILRIKSIVAHLKNSTDIKDKKGYVSVQLGENTINTSIVKSRNGQLVIVDTYTLEKEPKNNQAKIKVFISGKKGDSKMVGEGTLHLIGSKPARKMLLSKGEEEVGELFIDSNLIKKPKNRLSRIIENESRTIDESHVKERRKSPSIDFTRLQHFGILHSRMIKPILDYSQISSFQKKKKQSVVNHNNSIFMGKEKRFMKYEDKQTDRITYLEDRSLQFKDAHAKKFYRGASIGYGGKTDFAREQRYTPGVGNYNLPSIWDRY